MKFIFTHDIHYLRELKAAGMSLAHNLLIIRDMSLRITTTTDEAMNVVHIDGQLAGDGVAELGRECRIAGRPLALDLSNLRWTDTKGLQLIKTLMDQGVRIRGVSPFVDLLLKEERQP